MIVTLLQVDPTPQFTGTAVHYDVDIVAVEDVSKKKGIHKYHTHTYTHTCDNVYDSIHPIPLAALL